MASTATLERLCAEFDSPPEHIEAAVRLLEQNATPAYLAHYRRHEIGNLGEDRLHLIAERLHALTEIEARRASILEQAGERRTPELEAQLTNTVDQDLLDDIYQSMRPRRRSVAMEMEEKGLAPLAMAIHHRQLGEPQPAEPPTGEPQLDEPQPAEPQTAEPQTAEPQTGEPQTGEPQLDDGQQREPVDADGEPAAVPALMTIAATYVDATKGLGTPEQALEGAAFILADRIARDPATRARFRDELRRGILHARPVNPDQGGKADERFKDFFDGEPIGRISAGRMLALRRAEREGIVRLELTLPEGRPRQLLRELHGKDLVDGTALQQFYDVVFDEASRQLHDICGKDVRRRLKEKADREAVRTYARNLRSQLLAPPLGQKKVLALRTSNKVVWAVLLGEDGSVAQHKTLPLDTDEQKQGAMQLLVELIRAETPAAIAIPHGRRQAGSERLVAELRTALGETPIPMVVPVDEAASTIFATSTLGKKAIPGVEVGVRTAISLGRRLQDPLLELARMDARTLGIGQTLDDVHQGMLQRELAYVKASCLAQVGCDLNTVDQEVLELLPGLDAERAQAILQSRKQRGGFASRADLAAVPSIDAATVRNIAGFLRIVGGSEPLDATPIHPDDYDLVQKVAAAKGGEPIAMIGKNHRDVPVDDYATPERPRQAVIGVLLQLQHAEDDGRGKLVDAHNEGVHTLTDLHADRELRGRVANLTEFGAFVDLGIGQDGLVHISQIPGHRLRDPHQMLRVGEVVAVWVVNVDEAKKKISLTMLKPRHLQEGRLPTLGERLEQQKGRRQRGRRRDQEEAPAAPGRVPGASAGRSDRRGPREGGREGGGREGGRDGGRRFGGDRGDRGDRGTREQRIYTVEPAREVAETRTHKGEVTSLSSLRALLGPKKNEEAPKDQGKAPE
jgi:protein Tex